MKAAALSAWLLAGVASAQPLEQGRQFAALFLSGDLPALWARAAPSMKRQFGTSENLNAFFKKVKNDFGAELRVGGERTSERGNQTVYTRLSVFSLFARGVELELRWDSSGQLTFLSARPAVTESPSPHEKTVPKTRLRLPVDGVWNVLWGGRTWEDNRHAAVADQRFALDLLIWKGPGTFEGDGSKNSQFWCWGKAVVAPSGGTVVEAIDGIADNAPGAANPKQLYGNHVVLYHGGGEYSLLAHLMKGSLAVKRGDVVVEGQSLARTGNSGTSTEPHLHFQLMDAAHWLKAHGLPAVFSDYVADGKPLAKGEPRRGQSVFTAPAASTGGAAGRTLRAPSSTRDRAQ